MRTSRTRRSMSLSATWSWRLDLIRVLLKKELLVRYKGSFFGYLWSVMNPLATAGIYYVVFGLISRFNQPNYLIMLLAALFPWQWVSSSIGFGANCFINNKPLVKKVAFPRLTIPFVTNLQDMVHFLISLPVYIAFMFAYGLYPGINWLWSVPLMVLITLGTVYGICLFTGSINIFFRDLGYIVSIAMHALFFGCPIIYPLSHVPDKFHFVFLLNPLAPMMICWRSALYENSIDLYYLPYAILYAFILFSIGLFTYHKLHWKFAEAL
ncbi:ABC transporter permease [Oceanidesulfovibrio marinus]|uniref:Transport permease protein n=2 Tax=Oceanidesulfovibrio marinus TaxID=370038 RepID=A0ABX6NGP3_9BACT|nr:ABC transporter permease [Oceanidesulfovibrio marinus]